MTDIRIVFMGTPDFAVGILNTLYEKGYPIVGVITAPDRPAGRGRKLNQSAVKEYAIAHNLTILQPTNLKHPEFLEELKSLEANLQIVVAFRMLPKVVWQLPELGTFNLHASLLPEYRGAAPINWAIMNGETKTGATTFFIDEKIDTGAIILQDELPIAPNEDAGTLHDRLMDLGALTVLKTVKRIEEGDFSTSLQKNSTDLKLAYKLDRETCKIDWSVPLQKIYDHIRGLSPYPAAWGTLYMHKEEVIVKIYKVTLEREEHKLRPGTLVFDKKEMRVAAEGGFIKLLEIQLQGKRRMATEAVLNGLNLPENAIFR
ncbi:methionyl-tRNA formyltransferase [Maribacter antarcticus]|uniref:methionyl-tRNA formyltransferase n=1 Tax=Maribacter antarcticus TaxID=505250 RepID=UPI00047AD8E9|nr:methionyl-tRNA formyltransferase [Maribacter antarcticus]